MDLRYMTNDELREALELLTGENNRVLKCTYFILTDEIGRRKALNIWE